MTRLMTTHALISEIHQPRSSWLTSLTSTSAWRPSASCSSAIRTTPGGRPPLRRGRAASSDVPFELTIDLVAGARCRGARASARASSISRGRPLELRARACARRRRRRRAGGSGARRRSWPSLVRAGSARRSTGASRRRLGCGRAAARARRPRRTGGRRSSVAETSSKTTRRVRRELDAEALGELRDPRELVGARRDHGAALALEAALEVDRRAVALEVARAGQDEVGPADGEALEHRRSRSRRRRARRARARSGRRRPRRPRRSAADAARVGGLVVGGGAHASATPRPFGVAGR